MAEMKNLEYYVSLPYTIEMIREDEETWFARVLELPGCMTEGDSAEDAAAMIVDAMTAWIETALDDGHPVPEPRAVDDYSGRFVLRVSKSLHRDLTEAANRDGISLNQYLNVELARAVGRTPGMVETTNATKGRWPGLQTHLCRVLKQAGYRQQAEALDEHLFADWVATALAQVSAAIEIRDFVGAQSYLDSLMLPLRTATPESPLLAAFSAAVQMMVEQIETICQLRERIIDPPSLQARVSEHANRSNRFAAQTVLRDDTAVYTMAETPLSSQQREGYRW